MIANIMLFFTVVIWGWMFVATKLCLASISPVELLGFRLFIGLPTLLIIIKLRKIKLNYRGHYPVILIGSIILTVHFLIQITGIKYTSATNTGWIIALIPLVTAVLAYFILKEKPGRNVIFGIIIATTGIILLVSKGKIIELDWLSSFGDWLVLGSAHTWALYTIATRNVSRAINPLSVTFAMMLIPAVVCLIILAPTFEWSIVYNLPARLIVALLFIGILGTALAHWFWQEGVARIGAAKAGMFLYLEPLATTSLAVPYLGESFGLFTAAGGVLVLLGVWLAGRKKRRTKANYDYPNLEQ